MISSQIDQFKILLPEYKWSVVKPAGAVVMSSDIFSTQWKQEGMVKVNVICRILVIFTVDSSMLQ